MANIQTIPLNEKLRDSNPKINQNFQNLNTGLDGLGTRVDNIVAQGGDDNTEIVDARGGYPVLGGRLNALDEQFGWHKTERISHLISITRNLSLVGTQTIQTFIKPKAILVTACGLNAVNKRSDGMFTDDGLQSSMVVKSNGFIVKVAPAIFITDDDGTNATFGTISNPTDNSFDIVWSKNGAGATGTAELNFLVLSHY